MPRKASPQLREALLYSKVTGSRYFFLDLAEPAEGAWSLALGGRESCAKDYLLERQHYAYPVLEYVAEGRGEAVLDGRRGALAAGSVLCYSQETRCRISSDPSAPMLKFFFALSGRQALVRLRRAGLDPGTIRQLSGHGELRTIAEDLVREGEREAPLASEICRTLFELLLLKISDTSTWSDHGSPIARDNFLRCKSLVDANAARYSNLEELARVAGMDVSSICRLFRRFQGTSPYQYLLRRKMTLAAEILVDTGCLVKEAAQQVGFEDPFHFARCFKAVHGVPPTAVRGLGKREEQG